MGKFTDMWWKEIAPKVTTIDDITMDILTRLDTAMKLEKDLEERIDKESYAIFKEILHHHTIVREQHKYNSFKRGFIMGKDFAKEMEDFDNIPDLKVIEDAINKLKEEHNYKD